MVFGVIQVAADMFAWSPYIIRDTSGLEYFHALTETIVFILLISAVIWWRNPTTPKLVIAYLLYKIVLSLFGITVLFSAMGYQGEEAIPAFLGSALLLLFIGLWIGYFARSKRISNTYGWPVITATNTTE